MQKLLCFLRTPKSKTVKISSIHFNYSEIVPDFMCCNIDLVRFALRKKAKILKSGGRFPNILGLSKTKKGRGHIKTNSVERAFGLILLYLRNDINKGRGLTRAYFPKYHFCHCEDGVDYFSFDVHCSNRKHVKDKLQAKRTKRKGN